MGTFDAKVNLILNEDSNASKIRYSGAVQAPWQDDNHDWIVKFDIGPVKYEYVLHGDKFKILDWMDWKKKLSDPILLNYAKKNATDVYKIVDGVKTKL
jgi:hypothetical protein